MQLEQPDQQRTLHPRAVNTGLAGHLLARNARKTTQDLRQHTLDPLQACLNPGEPDTDLILETLNPDIQRLNRRIRQIHRRRRRPDLRLLILAREPKLLHIMLEPINPASQITHAHILPNEHDETR